METEYIYNNTKRRLISYNNKFRKLTSDFFLRILFNIIIHKRKSSEIIKYNKYIQKRIDININNYKDYSEIYSSIEIEIIPKKNKYGPFINIKEEEKEYYHIYFNNDKKEEIKRTNLNENDNVSKINIIIDYQVKSFNLLFGYCECIDSINFKKFYRNNIVNMNEIFINCYPLKELNLTNFNTNNVTNMSYMFAGCSSLKELNLTNFYTNNVTNMSNMFYECSSLKELNLNNFNTNNVINMSHMFKECSDELKLKIKRNFF